MRDGDGDGFVFDGTPRQRPVSPFAHTRGWKGKRVVPNPVGRSATPTEQQGIDDTIAMAEMKRTIPMGTFPSPEAAYADLSRQWTRDGIKATRGNQTIRLVRDGTDYKWKDVT